MTQYDYKVVPAPSRGVKAKGVKGAEARFAHAMELQLNGLAADGWEFLRAETLPSEERQGLTSTTTTYRSILVFRRPQVAGADGFPAGLLEAPVEDAEAEVTPDETPAEVIEDAAETEQDHSADPEAQTASKSSKSEGDVLRDRVAQLMDQSASQKAD